MLLVWQWEALLDSHYLPGGRIGDGSSSRLLVILFFKDTWWTVIILEENIYKEIIYLGRTTCGKDYIGNDTCGKDYIRE